MDTMTKAAADVMAERWRQILAEGWTQEHDDAHAHGEMADAAAAYAHAAALRMDEHNSGAFSLKPPKPWPFGLMDWKPGEPRRMLVKAAALLIAEIERIDRMAAKEAGRCPKCGEDWSEHDFGVPQPPCP